MCGKGVDSCDLRPLTFDPKTSCVLFHFCRIFALLFLSVSVVVAMACYLHQGYLIHRTRSGEDVFSLSPPHVTSFCFLFIECSIVRERNYWLHRYKAIHFYCRLWMVLVLVRVCVCGGACVCVVRVRVGAGACGCW